MRVVYVAPRYHTNQVPIVEGWLKDGHEVMFISQYTGGTEDYEGLTPVILGYPIWFRGILNIYKAVKQFMGKIGKEFFFQAKFGPLPMGRFRRIMKEFQPDIVIMRDRSIYNIGVTFICRMLKIPALLYNQLPLYEEPEIKGGVLRKLYRACTPKVRMTPVLGRQELGEVIKKNQIYYIPFVMEPHIAPDQKKYFLNDTIQILGVGKYVWQKRHEMILQVAKDIRERHPEVAVHFTIVGEVVTQEQEINLKNMEEYIRENELEQYITLKKNFPLSKVYEEYAKADIFVLPSKRDVASVSPLEAMSCSLPVISSDTNGTFCYIDHGVSGFVFKSKDYEEFRNDVEQLILDRDKIRSMGKAGYELVLSRHSFQHYKEGIQTIIDEIKG